ncbi:MAG: peptidoglycan editing factor PgeF, partial [Gammaproteobacteria bacterium]
GFNLADHVGDDPADVAANRSILSRSLGPLPIQWLEQVHGVRVVEAGLEAVPQADAVWTADRGQVLAVLTADCLPVVLADRAGDAVAIAHGGWRGLVAGILAETVRAMPVRPEIAWLGPAIGADVYEVGEEVLELVVREDVQFEAAVARGPLPGKGYLDLSQLAALQLSEMGIEEIYQSGLSTWDTERFYSYRREGRTGRMATLAWLR